MSSSRPEIELSAMGAVRPPMANVLAAATQRGQQGFNAIWWADHLLHWFPSSIWSPELVPQAAKQATPHVWFDPFPIIAAAAGATRRVKLGVGVTDVVRRHPVQLAQTALTLDHVTDGRFILGVGTGESLNITPIGLTNDHPVRRLEEALTVVRRLFDSADPVSFDGEFFTLRDMSLGVRPVAGSPPPIWLAAHRPQGLALAGATANGWMPIATDPADYARMHAQVVAAAQAAGRAADAVTPALYARIVVTDTAEAAARAIEDSLLLRFIALTRPAEAYIRHGGDHPLGAGAFGLTSLLPTDYGRTRALELARAVPQQVVRETVIHGTPADIARQIEAFIAVGVRHVQVTNMTPLVDPHLGPDSEGLLSEVVQTIRSGPVGNPSSGR
jgi:phthiodiolone/phenolphthiodiolone dimycocerosates ketoreductase